MWVLKLSGMGWCFPGQGEEIWGAWDARGQAGPQPRASLSCPATVRPAFVLVGGRSLRIWLRADNDAMSAEFFSVPTSLT